MNDDKDLDAALVERRQTLNHEALILMGLATTLPVVDLADNHRDADLKTALSALRGVANELSLHVSDAASCPTLTIRAIASDLEDLAVVAQKLATTLGTPKAEELPPLARDDAAVMSVAALRLGQLCASLGLCRGEDMIVVYLSPLDKEGGRIIKSASTIGDPGELRAVLVETIEVALEGAETTFRTTRKTE